MNRCDGVIGSAKGTVRIALTLVYKKTVDLCAAMENVNDDRPGYSLSVTPASIIGLSGVISMLVGRHWPGQPFTSVTRPCCLRTVKLFKIHKIQNYGNLKSGI